MANGGTTGHGEGHQRNICLIVEYDGRAYAGWQLQKGQRTIQGELRAAIRKMTGEDAVIYVAGRTDAGVSAIAQVANFKTRSQIDARRFAPGLNAHLPDDISVHRANEVPRSFNAKRHSLSKRYRYRIYHGPQPAALEPRSWLRRASLDVEAMRAAATCLVGHHDFDAFRNSDCDAPHAQRKMFSVEVTSRSRPPLGQQIDVIFHANAYCRYMCRILAGTLTEVGEGKRSEAQVEQALRSRKRTDAGITAPAHGLTLLEVLYPQEPHDPAATERG